MKKSKQALLGWVCVWWMGAAQAQVLTLPQAMGQGVAQHPQMQSAHSEIRAADAQFKAAQAGYYPTLSLAAGPQRMELHRWGYEASVSQMLYDWGRAESRVDGALALQKQTQAGLQLTRDQVMLDVAEVYLDVVLAGQQLEAAVLHQGQLTRILELAKARSSAGYSDRSEPERAALEITRAMDMQAADKGRLDNARQQLQLLTGISAAAQLEQPALPSNFGLLAPQALAEQLRQTPSLYKAQQETRRAQAEVKAAEAALYPQLNLEASALRRSVGGRMTDDSMVTVRLHMTPFQGNANQHLLESARQREEAARWKEEALLREMSRDVESFATIGLMLGERQRILARQAQESAALAALYAEQFQAGRREVIDLLNVQREGVEARRQGLDYSIQQLRMRLRIAARLGQMEELLP